MLKYSKFVVFMMALSVASTSTLAGSFSSRSSGSSSGGASRSIGSPSRSVGLGNSVSVSRASTGYKASKTASMRPMNRLNSKETLQSRRSLIPADGPQPPKRVAEIIRERESSGPGWLGTAFLITLLSRHDLSITDKSWIDDRIKAIRNEEGYDASALLDPVNPTVTYIFKGLEEPLLAGETARISVSAMSGNKPIPVTCDHPAAISHSDMVEITWTPNEPSVSLLTCTAGKQQERRLIRVLAKSNSSI